ncbi:MAG: hypothetical protein RX318_11565 [bacterium]|nr:hypothetical protein [bacterium]
MLAMMGRETIRRFHSYLYDRYQRSATWQSFLQVFLPIALPISWFLIGKLINFQAFIKGEGTTLDNRLFWILLPIIGLHIYISLLTYRFDRRDRNERRELRREIENARNEILYYQTRGEWIITIHHVLGKLINTWAGYFLGIIEKIRSGTLPKEDVTLSDFIREDRLIQPFISQLYALYEHSLREDSGQRFRVTFMEVCDECGNHLKITHWANARDAIPRSADHDISRQFKKDDTTVAGYAWFRERLMIEPNVPEALRNPRDSIFKALHPGHEEEDVGSIFCYPIFDRDLSNIGEDPFVGVISVDTNVPGYFQDTPESLEDLRYLMEEFEHRLKLQNRLRILKYTIE